MTRQSMGQRAAILGDLEQEVGVMVRRIRRVIAERARSVHDDLQVAAYFILANVAETGPKRASAVVEEFGIDKGAVSRQVQQLCDLGFLERTPDPVDGRAMMLSVTAEGQRRLSATAAERRSLLDQRLAGWSDEDLASFVTALGRYNRTLDARPTGTRSGGQRTFRHEMSRPGLRFPWCDRPSCRPLTDLGGTPCPRPSAVPPCSRPPPSPPSR
jgi:DNA-binding MarR family transcriptional regulator